MKHSDALKIVVCGGAGRMGTRIIELALQDNEVEIVAGVERKGFLPKTGLCDIVDDLNVVVDKCQVVLEFTTPGATAEHAKHCGAKGRAMVIGTTGLGSSEMKTVEDASKTCAILISPNMSWGMKVLTEVTGILAKKLDSEYDIELIEKHHRGKKDSPSGTALQIAREICKARRWNFPGVMKHGREGKGEGRGESELGVHAVRGGSIVGEHEVIFAGTGERIIISHIAESRDCFVKGTLRAAKFIKDKAPGLYTIGSVGS